ncbi:LuxR C-terminal-related transcriptional regulator [Dictyobacter formicarum]|uniref:LuxR family transcriptional regulator n=1 Tax=Dictyobacter formicarum TaxID=2778368 RepID=A0ABQ3VXP5_9CHLR|nr:LuxR C-terminal-related transcriptional regulator [Dictyobacter formicarum]GHO89821.1 LuxR family transcriptional regulator [Dictyobacter formicarum]
MARHIIPRVIDNAVIPPAGTRKDEPTIQIGSDKWYAWLNEEKNCSFAYCCSEGSLTARREHRHGSWYWYAYRTQRGHVCKTYLGKSEELSIDKLHVAARQLTAEKAPTVQFQTAHASNAGISTQQNTPSLHLLTTKIAMPLARPNMVQRKRLIQWMNTAVQGSLTLVVAPAGWGKTTLLITWYTQDNGYAWPLAWVSLDMGDNDPLRFWTYVISALNSVDPEAAKDALALLYASPPQPIETVLTSLLNALRQFPNHIVLVLEDYHLITAQPIHAALTYFIEHLPANIHLVIASRSDPQLPVARLRVRGALAELRAAHLRFTSEETTTFLTESMGLALSPEQIAALQVHTEGWIAGLQLAALSMQGRHDLATFIDAFTGSHRYIVDYLVEEVLLRQAADVQDFLLRTCILERLSGPLCDAVCERSDGQRVLEYLERMNLFLVALDDERQWYRYHHLFMDVLRNRLRQSQPTVMPELHRRASRWYEQHDLFDAAVTHALEIPDVEQAAHLIEQYAWFTNFPSQFQVLLGWLNRLPDAFVRTQPMLCLMHAITLMLTFQVEKVYARVSDAEQCLQKEMPLEQQRSLMCLIVAFRANLARLFGDYAQCVPCAHEALRLMPDKDILPLIRLFRPSTIVTAASAYMLNGDMTPQTEHIVEEAVGAVYALGNLPTTMRSISNLARLQLLQGRLRQAATTIDRIAQLVAKREQLHTLLNGADYYVILGTIQYEWYQLSDAEHHLKSGLELVRETMQADAEMIARGYIVLARLQYARKESQQAFATLNTFMRIARQNGFAPQLLAQATAIQVQLEILQGNLEAAVRWMESNQEIEQKELCYLHECTYLTMARVYIALGRARPAGPFLSRALALLHRFLEDAEAKMRVQSIIEALILRSLALQAQGHLTEALTALQRALTLAEPEGYISIFIEEGTALIDLLRHAYRHGIAPAYIATLLAATQEKSIMPAGTQLSGYATPMVEALTVREREVLSLLIVGASNREIAEQLVLSVNTVKKHVLNLCGKLGAQSRTQAIARARALEWL